MVQNLHTICWCFRAYTCPIQSLMMQIRQFSMIIYTVQFIIIRLIAIYNDEINKWQCQCQLQILTMPKHKIAPFVFISSRTSASVSICLFSFSCYRFTNSILNETEQTCYKKYEYFNFQLCIYHLSSAVLNATLDNRLSIQKYVTRIISYLLDLSMYPIG